MRNSIRSALKEGVSKVSDSAADYIRQKAERISDRIEERITEVETSILNKLMGAILIVLGIIFLGLSLFHLLTEFAGVNTPLAYMIIGLAVLALGVTFSRMKGGE